MRQESLKKDGSAPAPIEANECSVDASRDFLGHLVGAFVKHVRQHGTLSARRGDERSKNAKKQTKAKVEDASKKQGDK